MSDTVFVATPEKNVPLDPHIRAEIEGVEKVYSDDQPRVPAGETGGGRWTSDGSGAEGDGERDWRSLPHEEWHGERRLTNPKIEDVVARIARGERRFSDGGGRIEMHVGRDRVDELFAQVEARRNDVDEPPAPDEKGERFALIALSGHYEFHNVAFDRDGRVVGVHGYDSYPNYGLLDREVNGSDHMYGQGVFGTTGDIDGTGAALVGAYIRHAADGEGNISISPVATAEDYWDKMGMWPDIEESRGGWGMTAGDVQRVRLALDEASSVSKNSGYNPDQPRIPAGETGGGRWTAGGYAPEEGGERLTYIDGDRVRIIRGSSEGATGEIVGVVNHRGDWDRNGDYFRIVTHGGTYESATAGIYHRSDIEPLNRRGVEMRREPERYVAPAFLPGDPVRWGNREGTVMAVVDADGKQTRDGTHLQVVTHGVDGLRIGLIRLKDAQTVAVKVDFYTEGGVVHPIRGSDGYDPDIGDGGAPSESSREAKDGETREGKRDEERSPRERIEAERRKEPIGSWKTLPSEPWHGPERLSHRRIEDVANRIARGVQRFEAAGGRIVGQAGTPGSEERENLRRSVSDRSYGPDDQRAPDLDGAVMMLSAFNKQVANIAMNANDVVVGAHGYNRTGYSGDAERFGGTDDGNGMVVYGHGYFGTTGDIDGAGAALVYEYIRHAAEDNLGVAIDPIPSAKAYWDGMGMKSDTGETGWGISAGDVQRLVRAVDDTLGRSAPTLGLAAMPSAVKVDFYTEGGVVHPIRGSDDYDPEIGDRGASSGSSREPKDDTREGKRDEPGSWRSLPDASWHGPRRLTDTKIEEVASRLVRGLKRFESAGGSVLTQVPHSERADYRTDLAARVQRRWRGEITLDTDGAGMALTGLNSREYANVALDRDGHIVGGHGYSRSDYDYDVMKFGGSDGVYGHGYFGTTGEVDGAGAALVAAYVRHAADNNAGIYISPVEEAKDYWTGMGMRSDMGETGWGMSAGDVQRLRLALDDALVADATVTRSVEPDLVKVDFYTEGGVVHPIRNSDDYDPEIGDRGASSGSSRESGEGREGKRDEERSTGGDKTPAGAWRTLPSESWHGPKRLSNDKIEEVAARIARGVRRFEEAGGTVVGQIPRRARGDYDASTGRSISGTSEDRYGMSLARYGLEERFANAAMYRGEVVGAHGYGNARVAGDRQTFGGRTIYGHGFFGTSGEVAGAGAALVNEYIRHAAANNAGISISPVSSAQNYWTGMGMRSDLGRWGWGMSAGDVQRLRIAVDEALADTAKMAKGYNPDQPRIPAGEPDGGQWTSDGGGTPGWREGLDDKAQLKSLDDVASLARAFNSAHPNISLEGDWRYLRKEPEALLRSLDHLDRLAREFPIIPVTGLRLKSLGNGVLGEAVNQAIEFDPVAIARMDSQKSDDTRWYPTGTATVEGLMTHEFAHLIDHYVAQYGIDITALVKSPNWGYGIAGGPSESFACEFQAAYAPGSQVADDKRAERFREGLDEVFRYIGTDEDDPPPTLKKRRGRRRPIGSGGRRRDRTLRPILRRLRARLVAIANEFATIKEPVTKRSPTKKGRFTTAATAALMAAYNEAWAAGFSDAWADEDVLDPEMLTALGVSPQYIDEEGYLDEDVLGDAGISVTEVETALEDGRNTIAGATDEQNDFLKGLAALLVGGITAGTIASRMALYAASINPVYERGFHASVGLQGGDGDILRVEWNAEGDKDTCALCDERHGTVWFGNQEHPYPGDGRFGGPICEGGTNCRCSLDYRFVSLADAIAEGYSPGAVTGDTDENDDDI